MKTCSFCGNKNLREAVTDYIYKKDDLMMVFQDVPCLICTYCGEKYYKASVLKIIETSFQDIEQKKRKPSRKIEVPVETFLSH